MLYIVTTNGYAIGWRVGQEVPEMWAPENPSKEHDGLQRISYIQADGDEADFIIKSFVGIMFHISSPVQYWYGDLARTIYLNLKSFL